MSRMIFCGDLSIGDQPVQFGFGIDSIWSKRGYSSIFEGVRDQFEDSDYVIGNLECMIKERNADYGVSEWSMCCDRNLINALFMNHINVVSVANNHTMDYGKECFDDMVSLLKESEIKVIGLKEKPYEILLMDEKKIALIGVSYVGSYNKDEIGFFYHPSVEEWKGLADELSDCDYKIAYVHWGNEFINLPTQKQVSIAKEITEAGIDCIIGHHPHILQPAGLVNEKPVVFSLGNFVSDYWQERLKKTSYLEFKYEEEKPAFYNHECKIDKEGAPGELNHVQQMEFLTEVRVADKKAISKGNKAVQREYLVRMLGNFCRYRHRLKVTKWVWANRPNEKNKSGEQ